ncbi:MAG: nucleotide exchange factor GrpE [Firmicutes bacterium]|nr:nucleotide exchange factor GrpE [Bacillota bacterium]
MNNEEVKCKCHEGEDCICEDVCECGEECTCDDACECGDECTCGDTCECEDDEEAKPKKHKWGKKNKEIEELTESNKRLEQEVLMAKADLINYRKRKDEEVVRMLKYSNEDLVKEMLTIIDSLERAIDMDDDNLNDEVSKFLSGFKLIYCNLINTLEKYGVKAIDGFNKPFDPTYHQAVMTEKRDGVESGMVLDVLQKGYLLKDKVIRPAMVRVSE